ncbi:hypothetical protein C823_001988 [Eubacterium plexicaudatum ASF492]|nr:hypothetical protein C823_001988 [Eubacterium plexicaudatum ASF492]
MAKKRSSSTSDNSVNAAVSFKYEVTLWAVLALSIILFISNFGFAGAVGNFISSIFFGLFGLTAYIFPILLFAGVAFVIANRNNTTAIIKTAASVGFFVFICMFLELVFGGNDVKTPLDSYVWAAEHKLGGGLLGGLLTWLIRPNLGTISAYIIDIIMLIICIVLVTQRSLWKPIRSGSRKVYDSAKNETIRQRQQYQERRQRRIDNKVSGVSTDTSLKNAPGPEVSDNISEIRPDPALLQDFPIYMMNQPRPGDTPAAKMPQSQPVSQPEPQVQQTLAAAGMDFADVMSFPSAKTGVAAEPLDPISMDNIIPIQNRKVTLEPNLTMQPAGITQPQLQPESAAEEPGGGAAAENPKEEEEDIFSGYGDIFPNCFRKPIRNRRIIR